MFIPNGVIVVIGIISFSAFFVARGLNIALNSLGKQLNRFIKRGKIKELDIKVAELEAKVNFLTESKLLPEKELKAMENVAKQEVEKVISEIENEPDYFQ